MGNKPVAVFSSHVNGIEFDVTDHVTARLLRANSKSDFIHEVNDDGAPVDNAQRNSATGGDVVLE